MVHKTDRSNYRNFTAFHILLFNDTEEVASVAVPAGNWAHASGAAVGSTVTLQPFRSAVLVTTDAAPASPPYHPASGIDWRAGTPVRTYLGDDGLIFADGFESGDPGAWIVP